ncbi:phospholipase D family protein [Xanthomonas campestris pv. campestris]|uniref:phospholipase D family protein n=1 Tax=Xanthomonas campestris TaxID=339 RepID=UPI00265C7A95|nr:phospholipase D family protein [Xanthomonas campestris]MDO0791496.1 phospholipase D family protein [Xanthomonas campestris pv. campestris]MDO0839779.1 phospholipase D family protein [Xanthomonas campestris pv. campestris]
MDFEFCMQDPTDPGTRYLYEAIIDAAADAMTWRGMYAFATRGGVDQLIEDPVVHEFMRRGGEINLIVGIDAVTNRQTLERMQALEARHQHFHPKIFWNTTSGLFHPKISHFGYADGSKKLIVGSGNLTPGGLRHNFEGYSVISGGRREALDLSSLDAFIARHDADIRPIDQAALDRAALNVVRPIAGVPSPRAPQLRPVTIRVPAPQRAELDRVLLAQVPAAGGRWSQVHFNTQITEQYFRVTNVAAQRVYLTSVDVAGLRKEEEVRPVVFSHTNGNHKIEIAAAKGLDYPGSPPLLVFRERQVRCFDYMLLMPGSPGYEVLVGLSQLLPSIGRGFRRGITDLESLSLAWPECPLLTTGDRLDQVI